MREVKEGKKQSGGWEESRGGREGGVKRREGKREGREEGRGGSGSCERGGGSEYQENCGFLCATVWST